MLSLGVVTVIGNASVLIALKKIRRAPTHYPLASLASADFLIGVFVIPIAAARELFVFHLNFAICACWSALDVLCCTASILSLCALGWERWYGITAPLSRARRAKHARRYAALVWPTAALVALPTVLVPSPKHFKPGELTKACSVNTNFGYVVFSTFFSFYLPAVVMVVFYTKILYSLASQPQIRAHRGNVANVGQAKTEEKMTKENQELKPSDVLKKNIRKVTILLSPKRQNLDVPSSSKDKSDSSPYKNSATPSFLHSRQKRATRTIVMLMSLFLFCWTPFFIMLPIDSSCECVWEIVWQWCTWLGYTNSALNPIVYAAASPSVRKALQDCFTSTTSGSRSNDLPLSSNTR